MFVCFFVAVVVALALVGGRVGLGTLSGSFFDLMEQVGRNALGLPKCAMNQF
ncbi:hypothetical protein N9S30_00120 [bacterium]|nr:hypothetical protein [bacterium]